MAEFRKCFHAIDTENTGVITAEALRSYMQRMHYKEQFVSKWISLFDPNNEGVITYEGYCKTLGLIPKRREEEADQAGVKQRVEKEPKPTLTSLRTQDPGHGEKSPSSSEQIKSEDKPTTPPQMQPAESPKITEMEESKSIKEKHSKSKHSRSEKLDKSEHEEDVSKPSAPVEEPIVPTVHPMTIPCSPSKDQNEKAEGAKTQNQMSQDQEPKKQKTTRVSISSQSEGSQAPAELVESKDVVPDVYETQSKTPDIATEPMEVDEVVLQPKSPQQLTESKRSKQTGRKQKTSQSKDEPEHLTEIDSSEATLVQPVVEEELVCPVQIIDKISVPLAEPEHELETGKGGIGKRRGSHHSEPEQVVTMPHEPIELVSPTTEIPIQSQPDEQPMELVGEDIYQSSTTVQSQLSTEPVTQATSEAVKPTKTGKVRKSKRSQSDYADESSLPASSTITIEAVLTDESVQGKTVEAKKTRSKKPSPSHSEDRKKPEIMHPEPKTIVPAMNNVKQVSAMHSAVESKQSTTPLLSPSPITPPAEYVCISQMNGFNHSPQFHDVTHEIEMKQRMTSAEASSMTTNVITKSQPKQTIAVPKVPRPMKAVDITSVPATVSSSQPKSRADRIEAKISPQDVHVESKQQKAKDKSKPKPGGLQKSISEEQTMAAKTQPKETGKLIPRKQDIQKPPKLPIPAGNDAKPKKKAEKRKHDEAESPKKKQTIESDTLNDVGKKTKVYDPTLERLTRIRRLNPIPARKLKDKKPARLSKAKEAPKEEKEPEKKGQTSRFPKSFMVQPDGIRSMRQRKLALRQHERRLQRKIERLEKVKRKSTSKYRPKYPWKVRPSLRSRGVVVILLAGQHRGKRVVCLGRQRSTGLLLVTGPFRYNGCPLRRVHPNMVIATQTSVDLSKFTIPLRMHKKEYFARKTVANKRRKLDDTLLLKPDGESEDGYKPSEQRKADQKLVDSAVCMAIKAHEESRMLVKYLKSLFSLGKYDHPHEMVF
ncbi:60S ribosomal protein L6 [Fasciola gigantica]|uniref:Large ribosomal subunit protein eL6 n=1 Tax=Fasciola gigantica TaxID=46835 RepID=A0A504YUS7_FASGI|nr:60S ribosomal protein L6 [Fasciola gigantica]